MRRFTKAFLACLLITGLAYSQEVDLTSVYKIKEEGLTNSKVMDIAHHLTDVSGPRLTNSPGLKRAQDWAVSEMKSWGLQNVAIEKWGEFGRGWEVQKSYVAMTAPYYMALIASPKAWTPGTNGPIKGEVVILNATTEDELKQFEGQMTGKIVLFKSEANTDPSFEAEASRMTQEELENTSKQPLGGERSRYTPEFIAQYRARRAFANKVSEFLQKEGAALIIRGSRSGKDGTLFTTNGASHDVNADPVLPELEMSPEHANLMSRLIEGGVTVNIEAEIKTRFLDEVDGYNVVGEIPGTDKLLKDEIVMLGAHLDSWHAGTGATDNAAGSAVMMEVMRIIKQSGLSPKRTIRIALWSGEEQGLYGSKGYVKNHFADPEVMKLKPEHSKLAGYFNIDNGTGRIRGIYLQGNDAVRPIFKKWFEPFDDMIDNTTITIRNTGGTDHLAFDAVGLPGFQFIQDPIDYSTRTHHSNADLYERLIPADLKQISAIVASFVYNTAQRDQKLPRKPLPEAKPSRSF